MRDESLAASRPRKMIKDSKGLCKPPTLYVKFIFNIVKIITLSLCMPFCASVEAQMEVVLMFPHAGVGASSCWRWKSWSRSPPHRYLAMSALIKILSGSKTHRINNLF